MSEVTDVVGHFAIPLCGGEVIEYSGGVSRRSERDEPEPELAFRMPASAAHGYAHTIGAAPMASVSDIAAGRALELAAAALGDRSARACTSRPGGVSAGRRAAALAMLSARMPGLWPAQRIAVIDGVARWVDEDRSGELSWQLLLAVCGSEAVTNEVYRELMTPTAAEWKGQQ
jgi:hypothetical protein